MPNWSARRIGQDRFFLLTLVVGAAILSLLLLGMLYIQAIMIGWSVLMFYLIVRIEKKKRDYENSIVSENTKWQGLVEELDKVDEELKTAEDPATIRELQAKKRELERRIRESRWNLKEEELSSIFSASRGNLPRLQRRYPSDMNKLEKMIRGRLGQIRRECREIMKEETDDSKGLLFEKINNELKAVYWLAKSKNYDLPVASDIWVTWCILQAAKESKPISSNLLNYATDSYRDKALELVTLLQVTIADK
ncbi:MAG: hypothetical protein QXE12_01595 [Conexivisphaerales archaeon]